MANRVVGEVGREIVKLLMKRKVGLLEGYVELKIVELAIEEEIKEMMK